MRRLARLLRPQALWLVLAPVAMMVEVSMDLMQPKLMSRIVDEGITLADQSAIYHYGFRMLLFAFIGLLGGYGCTLASSRAALSFGDDLRRRLFRHIQSFSFAETDKFTTGSLITRLLNDVHVMQHVVIMITRMLIRSPLLLLGSIYLVITTNPRIAVPLLFAAPVLAGLVVWKIGQMRPQFERMQQRIDDLNAVMQENLTGIRVVKAFANEDQERERFDDANIRLTDTSVTTGKIMVTLGPMLSLVQHLTVVAIIFVAARDVDRDLIQIGEVAAILNYATQVMMSLIITSFHVMHFSRAIVSARRIVEVFDTTPSIRGGGVETPPRDGSVEFRNVAFRYPGAAGDPVLHGITLDIRDGEHLAIMGATGAGKTSFANLVPRFYDAIEGDVLVGGRNVREYSLGALRGAIGFVMQDTRLFTGTIAENIRWGDDHASDDDVRHVARIAGADGFIMSFTDGYDTEIAQGGVSLSGGQKQRIAIARALLKKPKVLILDDSTSAVDVITEARIQDALRVEMKGMTVIKIAQRISSVTDADRIALLENNTIAALGPHEELLKTSASYRDICDSQNALEGAGHVS
ncbi:MAG: ABC transporter ATP-binding protein [Kiritimatiellia bacterium]|jgi:ATP-binding cassette subfamily B multidrug efflux pump